MTSSLAETSRGPYVPGPAAFARGFAGATLAIFSRLERAPGWAAWSVPEGRRGLCAVLLSSPLPPGMQPVRAPGPLA